ncbi:MAG TPA: hypothetical protein VGA69_05920, partial [Nitriliruptorales bacterium]
PTAKRFRGSARRPREQFATAVLEELRRTDGTLDAGRVQRWPEHFDPAVELARADAGQRASYGSRALSPREPVGRACV